MRTSDTLTKISAAMSKAQKRIADPPMNGTGQVGASRKYQYARLVDILPIARAALTSEGLAFLQSIDLERDAMVTRITHESGEWIESDYPLQRQADPQKQGSANTYARRYALMSILGVAGDLDDDGDAAKGGKRPKESEATKKKRQATHHPSWKKEHKYFFAEIAKHGWEYEALCTELAARGTKDRPSQWDTNSRTTLLADMAGAVFTHEPPEPKS